MSWIADCHRGGVNRTRRSVDWGWGVFVLAAFLIIGAERSHAADSSAPQISSPGIEYFNQHEFTKAHAAFLRDLEKNPNDVETLIYLGRIAFEQNHIDDAAHLFERATSVAPKHSAAFHWLGRAYGIQARELGPPMGMGAARRTKRALETAVNLDPNNLEARLDLATYLRQAPMIVGGSRKSGLAQVEEICRRDPFLGALARGDVALDDKKFEEAERHYQSAVRASTNNADAYYRLGVLHQKTGRYEEAFAALEKVLQIDPAQKRALFQIGKTADLSELRLERGEKALQAYLQCEPFFTMPPLAWAHRRLGNIYFKKGARDAARAQYLAALKLAPGDKEATAALKHLDSASAQPPLSRSGRNQEN